MEYLVGTEPAHEVLLRRVLNSAGTGGHDACEGILGGRAKSGEHARNHESSSAQMSADAMNDDRARVLKLTHEVTYERAGVGQRNGNRSVGDREADQSDSRHARGCDEVSDPEGLQFAILEETDERVRVVDVAQSP